MCAFKLISFELRVEFDIGGVTDYHVVWKKDNEKISEQKENKVDWPKVNEEVFWINKVDSCEKHMEEHMKC